MNNFENETPAGYVTIEHVLNEVGRSPQGAYWTAYPGVTFNLDILDDTGNVRETIEITDRAAIDDMEGFVGQDDVLMYGTQDGDRFEGIAHVDWHTPVRLVDER